MDLGLLPNKVILEVTCVKAFAFQSSNTGLFEAQYKLQSLLFEIWLNNLSLGNKLQAEIKQKEMLLHVNHWSQKLKNHRKTILANG